MLKFFLRVGWVIGSGLFLCAAFLLYARMRDIDLSGVGRVEGVALEAVEAEEDPGGFDLTLDQDEHESSGDLRDVFAFKALPEATAVKVGSDSSLRVSGLIMGNRPGVVLEDVNSGRMVFLSEGETKDDLALLRVQADGARVRVSDRELLLPAPSRGE